MDWVCQQASLFPVAGRGAREARRDRQVGAADLNRPRLLRLRLVPVMRYRRGAGFGLRKVEFTELRLRQHANVIIELGAALRLRVAGRPVGQTPYGYDLGDDGTTLVEDSGEQVVILDIRARRKRGVELQQIADMLTDRSVPTKTGRSRR